ncbi:MAG: hypothetical protein K2J29_04085, partial [Muribaculaceae bacterium]|nr:hypothetical protein [Muribaculaceae bacterium]
MLAIAVVIVFFIGCFIITYGGRSILLARPPDIQFHGFRMLNGNPQHDIIYLILLGGGAFHDYLNT